MKSYFDKIPYITLNDVWIDRESGTTLVLDWILTKDQQYQISDLVEDGMNPNQARSRVLRKSDVLKACVSLGHCSQQRVDKKMLWHHEDVRNEIDTQIDGAFGQLDKDGTGTVVGDGTLKHLRTAVQILIKIMQHHRKQGRTLHLRLVGTDQRRDLAYRWLMKKYGLKIIQDVTTILDRGFWLVPI